MKPMEVDPLVMVAGDEVAVAAVAGSATPLVAARVQSQPGCCTRND